MSSRSTALLPLLFLACAHERPQPVAPPVLTTAPWHTELAALTTEASTARAIPLTHAVKVLPLDDAAFDAEYERTQAPPLRALQAELEAALADFTGTEVSALHTALAPRWSEVHPLPRLAFYDLTTHQLVVRRMLPTDLDPRLRFLTLAHEVGHALQDELGVAAWKPASFEESITQRAVLEGDAQLTATLLDAARQGTPLPRAVERTRLPLGLPGTAQVLELSGLSPKVLEAPPVVRELHLFPWIHGQRFSADLYQAGGLSLARHALEHPPTRTDALYAPQRWLDGTAPALQPLADPPQRIGLLLLRTILEQCQSDGRSLTPVIDWVEASYLDDSYRRVGRTLSWAADWDQNGPLTEAPGALGTAVVRTVLKCLNLSPEDTKVASREGVVGAVIGGPGADRERLATTISRTPHLDASAAHPGRPIPPPSQDVAFRSAGHGVLTDAQWVHAKLGLSMALPGGKVADNEAAVLTVTAPGAAMFVMFVDQPPTTMGDDGFVNALLDGFLKSSQLAPEGFPLSTRHPWSPTKLAWTSGRETHGEFEGPTALHAMVLPVCDGKASVNVVSLGFGPSGQRVLEAWRSSLKGERNPKVCSE